MPRIITLLGLFLVACSTRPHSLLVSGPNRLALTGEPQTAGCFDFGLGVFADDGAPGSSPVIRFTFFNHCADAAALDLRAPVVAARYQDVGVCRLQAYDPKKEIRAARLAPYASGRESIQYDPTCVGARVRPDVVCVDLKALVPPSTKAAPAACFRLAGRDYQAAKEISL